MYNAMNAPGLGTEGQAAEGVDALVRAQLRRLYPLNRLSAEALSRLLPAMYVERYSAGTTLYRPGDCPPDVCYLLQGAVCLYDSGHSTPQLRLTGGNEAEAMPLPLAIPAEERAVVAEDSLLLHIERVLLERATAHDPQIHKVLGVLPAAARRPATPIAATAAASGAATSQAPLSRAHRVLIIEHDREALRSCRALLKALGLRHDWVPSAEEAIEVLKLEHYGALLLDLDLPEGDYFDVVKNLQVPEPGVLRPLIIAMAQAACPGPYDSPGPGIDAVLSRPLEVDSLAVALARAGLSPRLALQRSTA